MSMAVVDDEPEHRYRELFEALPLALYLSLADGTLLGANPALVQLLGYPDRETLLGTSMGQLYCDPAARERWMAEVLREGIVRGFEAELRRFDGTPVLVRESTRAVWGDDGATVLFQGSLEDISEQRKAERALRDSEARYRTLFELARDSIFLVEDGRFVECNSNTRKMFRCQPREILGRSPFDFSPASQPDGRSSRDRALELLAAALAGEPQYFEWQHRRADGTLFDAEVSLDRLDLAGRPCVQAIVRDVTARRRAEEALRRRAAILDAVALAAARLLQAESWHDAVGEVLARLGEAASASRAYLVEGVTSGSVLSGVGERVEWVCPGLEFGAERSASRDERWLGVLAGGAVVAGPVRTLPAGQAGLLDEAVVSVAMVPVLVEGNLWGLIGFDDCFVEREWSAGELEAFRAAADILGSAIHLGRTRAVLEARTEELEISNRVNELLARVLDAKTVMQEITDIVRVRCGVDHVSVALLNDSGSRLDFVAWSGYDTDLREGGLAADGPGLIALAARTGERVYAADVASSDRYLCGDERVHSEYAVPLVCGGRLLGVLNCEAFAVDGIGLWEREVVDRLAAQAAIALRNAEVFRRLEASEAQYREFVEQLPDGVILVDAEQRVVLANPVARAALEVLGGEEEGILRRIGPTPLAVILEGCEGRRTLEVASAGPRPRVFEARAQPVTGTEGARWAVVLGEVTAEREAKRQLQIQERLAAVGQLAAGIAHDFNNMLQTIVLHCELSRHRGGEGDPLATRLEPIERQCAHGAALIRQVLDFARKTVTQPQAVDLAPFLDEATRLLARTIPERVVIRLEVEPGESRVVADPGQLQQLLTNLATNASDAMPDGGDLSIRLRRVKVGRGENPATAGLAPGEWAELEVSDTGCGMSPSTRARVFEPFFTTKQPGQGTGLGLAQVYGIVQQHAGSVTVTSEEGVGTTFHVYLPLATGVPLAALSPAPPPGQRGRGELVLVVEDDDAILELARDGLEALGYRVVAASSGAGAMEMVEHHGEGVVLVLSDMVMPGFGGVELARRVREAGLCPRVVLMTGYPLDGEAEELEKLGVVACLRKPFTMAQLASVVHEALRGGAG